MSYVVRRGAIYRWRRAVPEDLREVIGKREILVSLRTSDPREAKRLAHGIAAKVEQMFREARAALVSPAAADFKAAQEILAKPEDEQQGIGYHLTMKAEDGDARAQRLLRTLNATAANGAASPPISLVLDRWLAAKRPPAKTVIEWRRCIKILTDLVGDLPISALTKGHLREYQRHLGTMAGRTGAPLSSASQAKMLGAVRSVLSFAVASGDLETNPGDGLKVIKTSQDELKIDRRMPYSAQDLAVLFSEAALEDRAKAGPASAWLPWLGLWTGARLAELTDLRIEDIKSEREIPFFDLTVNEDRRLKNKSSRRVVPVASALVDLGFLKYVEERRAVGAKCSTSQRPPTAPDLQSGASGMGVMRVRSGSRTRARCSTATATYSSTRFAVQALSRRSGRAFSGTRWRGWPADTAPATAWSSFVMRLSAYGTRASTSITEGVEHDD